MAISYTRITGTNVERLAALSDGIFAVAMTLLVLELRVPSREAIHNERDLWLALEAMFPQIITYLMSFLTLGIFWNGQQAQLNHLERSDHHLTWIHIAFLFPVSILPFSTRLLADFIGSRVALLCYWVNVLLLGVTLFFGWNCALAENLLKRDTPPGASQVIRRTILVAQALYAFAALLCFVNPYASIGVIVLVQLYYAIAPTARRFSRSAGRSPAA